MVAAVLSLAKHKIVAVERTPLNVFHCVNVQGPVVMVIKKVRDALSSNTEDFLNQNDEDSEGDEQHEDYTDDDDEDDD